MDSKTQHDSIIRAKAQRIVSARGFRSAPLCQTSFVFGSPDAREKPTLFMYGIVPGCSTFLGRQRPPPARASTVGAIRTDSRPPPGERPGQPSRLAQQREAAVHPPTPPWNRGMATRRPARPAHRANRSRRCIPAWHEGKRRRKVEHRPAPPSCPGWSIRCHPTAALGARKTSAPFPSSPPDSSPKTPTRPASRSCRGGDALRGADSEESDPMTDRSPGSRGGSAVRSPGSSTRLRAASTAPAGRCVPAERGLRR